MSWKTVKLKTVAKISAGQSAPKDNDFNIQTGLPFIRAGHIEKLIANSNIIELPKISKENALKNRLKVLNKGSILFAKSGMSAMMNRVYLVDQDAYYVSHLASVTPNNEVLDSRFCYYFLMHFKTSKLIKDSAYPSIGLPDIENLEIPLPPLATQKRIAEILDAADALRRKDQELLKKYDELAQAIFIDMFGDPVKNEKGWEVLELENLCTDIADCPHTTPIHSSIITEFPCIRTSEMKNGKIFWGSMKYLDEEAYLNRVKRIEPNVGDIIYAREGTYGQAVLLPKGFNFALGQRTMLLRPDTNKISNEFLWYQINSDFVYRQAKKKNMGSTVGHVNVADVKKFNIIRPPLNLQMKFAETIKQLCNLEILMADKYSDTLFNSLIQKAFKGELV
jgi:type I restriction enzyme S subunit